jgi:UDP-N-acetylmuramate dehydrogenase
VKGVLRLNEPLAPYTAWHIGGPAARYYRPTDLLDLLAFLSSLPQDEPLTWLGLGSNVLIADTGIKGTVIHTLGMEAKEPEILNSEILEVSKTSEVFSKDSALTPLAQSDLSDFRSGEVSSRNSYSKNISSTEPVFVRAYSGLPCAKLAKFCAKQGIIQAEFFAGIPGTIGGALTMNAGAFGGETWHFVEKVEVVNRQGECRFRFPDEYQIAYRTAKRVAMAKPRMEEWFVAGYFRFERGDASIASDQIKQLLRRRNETQPIGVFSCGSVFKNPPGDFSGRLIESSNLKGFRIGDVEVSPKHANFIINHGKGKAQDVLALIHHIQETVWKNHQVRLEPEVRLLGFDES